MTGGCSLHAHSEFHTGSGGESSAGAENASESAEQPHHAQHEGRHSPAGRDNVVRVTGTKPAVEQAGDTEEPARTAVHPTGDVPPSSSADTGGAAAGGAHGSSDNVGSAASESPKQAESAPPGATPADETPSGGKGSLKSPSEPHIATPSQKPRKVHRTGTSKEGRRQ
jgi:hypothetical protein